MKLLSTEQVADLVGIGRVTLERWLAAKCVPKPKSMQLGKREFRNWTQADVERLRKYKDKNYRKGRGRKPAPKYQ